MVSGASEIALDSLNKPPRGIKEEIDFEGAITIVYHRISPLLLFFIPFTALWSGGSMWGIYGTQIRKGMFSLHESLFGLPFLFGTIVLLGLIAFLLLGRWQVTLKEGAGSVFVGVGPFGWTRSFTYNRNTLVSLRMTDVRVNNVPQKGISIRTNERDFVFGTMLKNEAKQFIAASIMKAVTSL